KGVGKATAKRLIEAGYVTFAALAAATSAEDLKKLQDSGFATAEIDQWVKEAATFVDAGSDSSEGGNGSDAGTSTPPASADAGGAPSGSGEGPSAPDAP